MKLDPRRIEMVDEDMAAVLRRMTGAQRLRVVGELFRMAKNLISARLREQHPDWDELKVASEASRRMLDGNG